MTLLNRAGLACFAAAAAWPVAMGALASALMPPLERAMRDAFCGVPYHDAAAFMGHCAACWAGSAILGAAGLWLVTQPRREQPAAITFSSTPSRWP
jgi:hypothetical protein